MQQQTNHNFLQNFWDTGKFASSWIISTDDLDKSLNDLKEFARKILGVSDLPLENNPDFRIVQRGLNTAKNEAKYISVEQIRELQNFMNSTSAVSDCKIAVIFEADLMNMNAYNCCLKILEEAPRDSYIFLITQRPGNVIPTIRSRCVKIKDCGRHSNLNNLSEGAISPIDQMINKASNAQKIKYLQEISGKDSKELWQGFCVDVLEHLHKMRDVRRFDYAQKLIQDTRDFDLDKRHMGILILECLIPGDWCNIMSHF